MMMMSYAMGYLVACIAPAGAAAGATRAPRVDSIATPLERVAFGSCNDQFEKQPMWDTILARKPQLWLWMGDAVRERLEGFCCTWVAM